MSNIIMQNNKMVDLSIDFEKKSQEIIEELKNSVFNIDIEIPEDKKAIKYHKNEIMPLITPLSVITKLNQLLSKTRPFDEIDAKSIEDLDYLKGYWYYNDIILYINKYIAFLPDKQTFCAFVNITTDIYNKFLQDTEYCQVFKSIDEKLISTNYIASQSGIVDNKTVISKLQTRDAGHNLIKNDKIVLFSNKNEINEEKLKLDLDRYNNMIKFIEKKGGKK